MPNQRLPRIGFDHRRGRLRRRQTQTRATQTSPPPPVPPIEMAIQQGHPPIAQDEEAEMIPQGVEGARIPELLRVLDIYLLPLVVAIQILNLIYSVMDLVTRLILQSTDLEFL
jgi:hypothetical protein